MTCPGCGSIQCTDCYPQWGESYNAATQGRRQEDDA